MERLIRRDETSFYDEIKWGYGETAKLGESRDNK